MTFDPNAAQNNTVGNVVQEVRQQASARLASQIGQASGSLDTLSDGIHSLSSQLREQDQVFVAGYTDRVAEQVQRVATYLHDKDLDQLVSEAERFARRQPAVAVGSAFVLGLLAARFLKSSAQNTRVADGSATETYDLRLNSMPPASAARMADSEHYAIANE
jgi:hypothetical protein